jgi:adenylyltransferase/sulfurtransferase
MTLRDDQIRRYSRHVLLPDVGGVGQARLLAGAVVIDELDDLGQVALLYLAAAGVGRIVVTDTAIVDAPGPLFHTSDVGALRAAAAARRAQAQNPDVAVVAQGSGVAMRRPAPSSATEAAPIIALAAGAVAARQALRELLS